MSRTITIAVALIAIGSNLALAQPQRAAATVNGQIVPQAAIDRALERFSEAERETARKEILDFLIDNALVDQYLLQQKVQVEQNEVDARLAEIKKEIEKTPGQSYAKVLESLKMTDAEFVVQVANDLRWEKFTQGQCTDTNLKALFDQNLEMFDGSMTRARHILLTPASDAKSQDSARTELLGYRRQIEAKAAEVIAKLPATADALTREQERQKQLEIAFIDIAKEKSTCPSKRDGGELPWFPRAGSMVEPFAKAAFAMKAYELSEPIPTQFGWHLILVTGKKPGQKVKFEDLKEEVREVYCNRLREAVVGHMKKTAQIVLPPAK